MLQPCWKGGLPGIEKNEDVALFKKRPVDYIDVCNQRIKEAKRTFETEQQAIS